LKISIITVAFLVELLYVGNNLHSSLQDIKVENLSDYFRFIKKKCIFAFKFSRRNEN
jgi:hypothetical protein